MPETIPALPKPSRRTGLLLRLLVAAQVLYVLGVAGAGYATTAFGKHVVLVATPADLRTLAQGDFVRLRYAISEVPSELWRDAATPPRRRQGVYVLLGPPAADTTRAVLGVYPQSPAPTADQAVLRAWITDALPRTLALRYNLERYYVPAASPMRRPKAVPRPLRVRVSIAPWGQARIETVHE